MPSTFVSAAVAALSLSGMASAGWARRDLNSSMSYNETTSAGDSTPGSPTNGTTPTFQNGTSVSATPNFNNGTSPSIEGLICPEYDNQVLIEDDGTQYLIQCGTNYQGTVLAIRKVKRQSYGGAVWLIDCIDECNSLDGCVGTGYNIAEGTCTYYSALDTTFADANVDFAVLVEDESAAASATTTVAVSSLEAEGSQLTTATIYSTDVETITSCAPTVTDCPARTVTSVISLYTTVCPVSDLPGATATTAGFNAGFNATLATTAAPTAVATVNGNACSACSSTISTATIYSLSTSGSSTGLVPVGTSPVVVTVVPSATGAALAAASEAAPNGVASGEVATPAAISPGVVTTAVTFANGTSSTLTYLASTKGSPTATHGVMYTGAASHQNAGMGFAVLLGAAAFIL